MKFVQRTTIFTIFKAKIIRINQSFWYKMIKFKNTEYKEIKQNKKKYFFFVLFLPTTILI